MCLLSSLTDDILKNNTDALKAKVFDLLATRDSYHWDVLSWILERVGSSETQLSEGVISVFHEATELIAQSFSSKELLLVLLGHLENSENWTIIEFSLPFLHSCISSIGLGDVRNTKEILSILRHRIHKSISDSSLSTNRFADEQFITLFGKLGKFFKRLFSPVAGTIDYSPYTHDILLYFEEPLFFVEVSDSTKSIFAHFLSVLQTCTDGLYSHCYQTFRRIFNESSVYNSENSDVPWIHVLELCLNSGDRSSYWPSVLTDNHNLTLFVYTVAPFIQKLEQCLLHGKPFSLLQTKQLIRAQECLIRLCAQLKSKLTSFWWGPIPLSLIRNFESISKHPISSQEIPVAVKNCILSIEALLSASTLTSRCALFPDILDRSLHPYHCGIRAHMVTVFKNLLHETWLKALELGIDGINAEESASGESKPIHPLDAQFLREMCKRIYKFPLTQCTDTPLDQFSWLMAALNMAIYVNIRSKAIANIGCSTETKALSLSINLAFSRPNDRGNSAFKLDFIEPLTSEVASLANRYQKAAREHEQKPDSATIAPGAPGVKECEMTLLRLRLLMDTVARVGAFSVA